MISVLWRPGELDETEPVVAVANRRVMWKPNGPGLPGMHLVFDGEEHAVAYDPLVCRVQVRPALLVDSELPIGGVDEALALVLVLADEHDRWTARAFGQNVAPPASEECS